MSGKRPRKNRENEPLDREDTEPETEPEAEAPAGEISDLEREDIFSRFAGADLENLQFHVCRKREDGQYYQVAVFDSNGSWSGIASKFGGGEYKVNAIKDGRIKTSALIRIDPDVFPPKAAQPKTETLRPGSDVSEKIDRLISLIPTLLESVFKAAAPAGRENEETFLRRLTVYKEILGGGTGADKLIEVFKSGLELARDVTPGGKSPVEMLLEQAPRILGTVDKAIEARRTALNRLPAPAAPAPDGNGNGHGEKTLQGVEDVNGIQLLDRVFEGAVNYDPDFDFYAVLIEKFASPIIKAQIKIQKPGDIVNYISALDPKYTKLIANERVRAWFENLIAVCQAPIPAGAPDGGEGGVE